MSDGRICSFCGEAINEIPWNINGEYFHSSCKSVLDVIRESPELVKKELDKVLGEK